MSQNPKNNLRIAATYLFWLSLVASPKIQAVNRKIKRIRLIICLIYMILSEQKIEEIQDFLQRNGIKIMKLIYCMDKYKNIFLHSLKLFPNYSFIINNFYFFINIIDM